MKGNTILEWVKRKINCAFLPNSPILSLRHITCLLLAKALQQLLPISLLESQSYPTCCLQASVERELGEEVSY